MSTAPTNVTISAYVPKAVADAIKERAAREDRTTSKVAGKILAAMVMMSPEPDAKFSRRRGKRAA